MHVEKGHSINIVLTFNSASGSFEAGRGLRCFKSRHEGSFSQRWAVDLLIPHNFGCFADAADRTVLVKEFRAFAFVEHVGCVPLVAYILIERTDLDGLRG